MNNEKQKAIGALWNKRSKSGAEFFTGQIEHADGTKTKIVVFLNRYKESENHPDWKIFISQPQQQRQNAQQDFGDIL